MKKIMGLGTMLLAGLLVSPSNLWLASSVLAQSDAKTIEDQQLQELRQKRQEVSLLCRSTGRAKLPLRAPRARLRAQRA